MRLRDLGVSLALHGVLCGAVVTAGWLSSPASRPLVIPLSFELVEASLPAAPSAEPGSVPTEEPEEPRSVPLKEPGSVPTEEPPMEPPEEELGTGPASVGTDPEKEPGTDPEKELGTDPEAVGTDPKNVEEIRENHSEGEESAPVESAPVEQAHVVSDPVALNRIVPVYPRAARRKGHEGNVTVAAVVTETGVVASADVLASSGHAELDDAALAAVRTARFAPATEEGVCVSGRVRLVIAFKLKGGR